MKDDKDKVAFYSLLRVLLTKLARLSDSQLHQFASNYCQELLALSMTTARGFKDLSGTPKDLHSSLMGDVFSMAAALARCAISEAAPSALADYTETLIGDSDVDTSPSRETTVAILSVCMDREPLTVLHTLLNRLSPTTPITIITTIGEYCNRTSKPIPPSFSQELSQALPRLIGMNKQVTYRLLDTFIVIVRHLRLSLSPYFTHSCIFCSLSTLCFKTPSSVPRDLYCVCPDCSSSRSDTTRSSRCCMSSYSSRLHVELNDHTDS